jgi:hypothetical protein
MTTSLRDKLKWLVFGQPCFFPYSSQDVLARSGRFYIGVSWTEYRRRRALPLQLLLGSQRKLGSPMVRKGQFNAIKSADYKQVEDMQACLKSLCISIQVYPLTKTSLK